MDADTKSRFLSLLSRRFLLVTAIYFSTVTLLATALIDQGTFTTLTITITGGYLGANTAQKISGIVRNGSTPAGGSGVSGGER